MKNSRKEKDSNLKAIGIYQEFTTELLFSENYWKLLFLKLDHFGMYMGLKQSIELDMEVGFYLSREIAIDIIPKERVLLQKIQSLKLKQV